MIEVENLTRRYGDLDAVIGVSFSVGKGEVVGLLGHNGAGKSTIMKMMTGYLEPTSGSIRVDNLRIGPDTPAIQSRIGYLPENCPVWPDMTVIDFLAYHADLAGVAPSVSEDAIARSIRRTALAEKATARIETLSRGYRQRMGVAQAILHDPDIVILDEPTNGLDPTQVREMRGLIRELAERATVIISTHVLQEVQAVCERVLILRAGRLEVDRQLDDLGQFAGLSIVTDRDDLGGRLAAIVGVTGLSREPASAGRVTYRLDAGPDAAPALARAVCDAGAALFALEPRRQDLETLFAEVNAAETNKEQADAA